MLLPAFIGKKIANGFSKGAAILLDSEEISLIKDVMKAILEDGHPESPLEATIPNRRTEVLEELGYYEVGKLIKLQKENKKEYGPKGGEYEMEIAKKENYMNAIINLCRSTKLEADPKVRLALWKGIDHKRLKGILEEYDHPSSSTSASSLQEPNYSNNSMGFDPTDNSSIYEFVRHGICPTLKHLLAIENMPRSTKMGIKWVKKLSLNQYLIELREALKALLELNKSPAVGVVDATSTTATEVEKELKERKSEEAGEYLRELRDKIFMLRSDCEEWEHVEYIPPPADTRMENQTDDAGSWIKRLRKGISSAGSSVKGFVSRKAGRFNVANQEYNIETQDLIKDFMIRWTPDKQRRQYKSLFTGLVESGYDDPKEGDFNWLRKLVKEDVFPIVKRFKNAKVKRRELTDNEFSKKLKEVDATLHHLAMVSGWETNDSKSTDKSTSKSTSKNRLRPVCREVQKEKRKYGSKKRLDDLLTEIKLLITKPGDDHDDAATVEDPSTSDCSQSGNTEKTERQNDDDDSSTSRHHKIDDGPHVETENDFKSLTFASFGRVFPLTADSIDPAAAAKEPPAAKQDDIDIKDLLKDLVNEVISLNNEIDPAAAEKRMKVNEAARDFLKKWSGLLDPSVKDEESISTDVQTAVEDSNSDNSAPPPPNNASGTGGGDWLRKSISEEEVFFSTVRKFENTEVEMTTDTMNKFLEKLEKVGAKLRLLVSIADCTANEQCKFRISNKNSHEDICNEPEKDKRKQRARKALRGVMNELKELGKLLDYHVAANADGSHLDYCLVDVDNLTIA